MTATGVWSATGNGGFSPSQTNLGGDYILSTDDITNTSVMIYLTSTNNGNCLAVTDSMEVQIIDFPVITITTEDSLCSSNSVLSLTGTVTSGFSTNWSTSGFGTISDPTSQNTVYSISPVDIAAGFVDVIFATTDICPVAHDSIRVIFVSPPQANAGMDQVFCENAPVQLNGHVVGADTSGVWTSMGTGSFSPSPSYLNGFYFPGSADIANGNVNLILSSSSSFGCPPDKDTITITFNKIPMADFSFTNVCQSSNMPFTDASVANSGTLVSWQWNFGDTATSISQNPLHNYATFGTLPVQLIITASNGCTDTIVKDVTVYPLPQPGFTTNIACEDFPTVFSNTSFIPTGSIISYTYDFNGIGSSSNANTSFIFPNAGTYYVSLTATSDFGCVNTVIQDVEVHAIPDANFSATPNPALVDQDITFTDVTQGNIIAWQWNFGDGQGDNQEITQHAYPSGGVYTVTLTVTDNIGCMDTVSKEISIALLPVLPTGFTPNGDGENDVYIIRGGPFKSVDFKIYNNWGQLIFESHDAAIGWDGTYKGEPAPLGVYTWTFVVDMGSDFVVKESGDVTLIR